MKTAVKCMTATRVKDHVKGRRINIVLMERNTHCPGLVKEKKTEIPENLWNFQKMKG